MKAYALLLICLCVLISTIRAQDPSYSIIGEETLLGIDIYDLHQADDGYIWLATNQGVYRYDGIQFETVNIPSAKTGSFFNLAETDEGILFHSLNGQFFIAKGLDAELYFEIPDSLVSNMIAYAANRNGDMTIAAKALFRVRDRKMDEIIYPTTSLYPLIFSPDHVIMDGENVIIEVVNGNVTHTPDPKSPSTTRYIRSYRNQLLYFNPNQLKISYIEHDETVTVFTRPSESGRLEIVNEQPWVLYNSSGVEVLDSNFQSTQPNHRYFSNYLISTTLEDSEGNIWLGTFGDGLLLIPDMETRTINGNTDDINIRRITSNEKGTVFIGSQKGNIYQINNNVTECELLATNNKNIEFLEAVPKTDVLLYDSRMLIGLNLTTGDTTTTDLGALKDMEHIGNDIYVIATNTSALLYNPFDRKHDITHLRPSDFPHIYYIEHCEQRFYCANYHPLTKSLYLGSSTGLKLMKPGKKPQTYRHKGNTIAATDIKYHDGKMYVSTQKNGILVFDNDTVSAIWNEKTGFLANHIRQLQIHEGLMYASTNKGILVCDLDGKLRNVINRSSGLSSNMIADFEIIGHILYVVHHRGIQRINLNTLRKTSFIPEINIERIDVNDSLLNESVTSFPPDKNKFRFHLRSHSFRYKHEIIYHYRLLPLETGWSTTPFDENILTYKSLMPGDYTFEVKAQFRDAFSEVTPFTFTIEAPFWKKWWFYALIITITMASVFIVYNYQVRKKLKKAIIQQELNASKLTAIQSQMNPHFIFNALNSIQDLILKEDVDNSYSYITTFANLVRKTLKYSDQDFIDFEQETELLQLYLKIEKLRFGDTFEYHLESSDIGDIMLPPMLIQPFVENAIVHGLLHKTTDRKLVITFKMDEQLICIIEDNGIGRKAAAEIKDRKAQQESFSTTAIKKRFDILKSQYGHSLGVHYDDLQTGTRVTLHIPVKRRF